MSKEKEIIFTKDAPSAIGPYSQGIVALGNFIFISGQIPLDPSTGIIVSDDIENQTKQSLNNIKQILSSSGADMKDVIKTTVFLSDMNDFTAMNKVYSEFFTENCPARSAVEVSRLPKDAKVEIEAIAII